MWCRTGLVFDEKQWWIDVIRMGLGPVLRRVAWSREFDVARFATPCDSFCYDLQCLLSDLIITFLRDTFSAGIRKLLALPQSCG
jgi:hypothetical protein